MITMIETDQHLENDTNLSPSFTVTSQTSSQSFEDMRRQITSGRALSIHLSDLGLYNKHNNSTGVSGEKLNNY